MKIAFIYSESKLSGKLTKWFTGSYCYHTGFVDDATDTFYDMDLIRRKRYWSEYSSGKIVKLVNTPVNISSEYLEHKLKTDSSIYGFLDYILFGVRPLYHLFGKSTRNAKGIICSEMVYLDLKHHGWLQEYKEVPSPADLERVLVV